MKIIRFEKSVSKRVSFSDGVKKGDGPDPLKYQYTKLLSKFFEGKVRVVSDVLRLVDDVETLKEFVTMTEKIKTTVSDRCSRTGKSMVPIFPDGSSTLKAGIHHVRWFVIFKELLELSRDSLI